MNDAPGSYGDNSGYMEVHVAALDNAACTAQPSLQQPLPPGFYIAEITTQPGTREGYWGLEVLADRGLLAGGFNLGGAMQEMGTTAGFGAFYIERAQTVRVRVDAQVIPGGDANNAGMTVRLLNASRQPVGEARSGTAVVEFSESLQPGFYIIEIVAASAAARATYQMGLGADLFSAGVNVGGFVLPGVAGFGAFYLPETQNVNLRVYGLPTYTSAGAPCLRLKLLDADRRVLFTAP
jgi:hypothetical protein